MKTSILFYFLNKIQYLLLKLFNIISSTKIYENTFNTKILIVYFMLINKNFHKRIKYDIYDITSVKKLQIFLRKILFIFYFFCIQFKVFLYCTIIWLCVICICIICICIIFLLVVLNSPKNNKLRCPLNKNK